MLPQSKHYRFYEKKHKILDGDILRDHAVQWTLIQSLGTSRTMFIAAFNDAGDIYMINNSIHRKHKYIIRFYKGVL